MDVLGFNTKQYAEQVGQIAKANQGYLVARDTQKQKYKEQQQQQQIEQKQKEQQQAHPIQTWIGNAGSSFIHSLPYQTVGSLLELGDLTNEAMRRTSNYLFGGEQIPKSATKHDSNNVLDNIHDYTKQIQDDYDRAHPAQQWDTSKGFFANLADPNVTANAAGKMASFMAGSVLTGGIGSSLAKAGRATRAGELLSKAISPATKFLEKPLIQKGGKTLLTRGALIPFVDNSAEKVGYNLGATGFEAYTEAQDAYNDVIKNGGTEEQANDAAYKTFKGNMALLGISNKIDANIFGRLLDKTKPIKGLQPIADMGKAIYTEGMEETAQDRIKDTSEGKRQMSFGTFAPTPMSTQELGTFLLGGVLGAGAAGLGHLGRYALDKATSTPQEKAPQEQQPKTKAGMDMAKFREAIGQVESGGQYSTDTGNGYLGKYQISKKNWANWAEKAGLGRDADWRIPANQDAVFNFVMNGYVKKYGYDGAARAWSAGEGGMNGAGAKAYAKKVISKMNKGNDANIYFNKYKGIPYEMGGDSLEEGHKKLDCSAFTMHMFEDAGFGNIGRTSENQWHHVEALAKQGKGSIGKDMQNIPTGALLFRHGDGPAGHVAIYMGNGMIAEMSSSQKTAVLRHFNSKEISSRFEDWGYINGAEKIAGVGQGQTVNHQVNATDIQNDLSKIFELWNDNDNSKFDVEDMKELYDMINEDKTDNEIIDYFNSNKDKLGDIYKEVTGEEMPSIAKQTESGEGNTGIDYEQKDFDVPVKPKTTREINEDAEWEAGLQREAEQDQAWQLRRLEGQKEGQKLEGVGNLANIINGIKSKKENETNQAKHDAREAELNEVFGEGNSYSRLSNVLSQIQQQKHDAREAEINEAFADEQLRNDTEELRANANKKENNIKNANLEGGLSQEEQQALYSFARSRMTALEFNNAVNDLLNSDNISQENKNKLSSILDNVNNALSKVNNMQSEEELINATSKEFVDLLNNDASNLRFKWRNNYGNVKLDDGTSGIYQGMNPDGTVNVQTNRGVRKNIPLPKSVPMANLVANNKQMKRLAIEAYKGNEQALKVLDKMHPLVRDNLMRAALQEYYSKPNAEKTKAELARQRKEFIEGLPKKRQEKYKEELQTVVAGEKKNGWTIVENAIDNKERDIIENDGKYFLRDGENNILELHKAHYEYYNFLNKNQISLANESGSLAEYMDNDDKIDEAIREENANIEQGIQQQETESNVNNENDYEDEINGLMPDFTADNQNANNVSEPSLEESEQRTDNNEISNIETSKDLNTSITDGIKEIENIMGNRYKVDVDEIIDGLNMTNDEELVNKFTDNGVFRARDMVMYLVGKSENLDIDFSNQHPNKMFIKKGKNKTTLSDTVNELRNKRKESVSEKIDKISKEAEERKEQEPWRKKAEPITGTEEPIARSLDNAVDILNKLMGKANALSFDVILNKFPEPTGKEIKSKFTLTSKDGNRFLKPEYLIYVVNNSGKYEITQSEDGKTSYIKRKHEDIVKEKEQKAKELKNQLSKISKGNTTKDKYIEAAARDSRRNVKKENGKYYITGGVVNKTITEKEYNYFNALREIAKENPVEEVEENDTSSKPQNEKGDKALEGKQKKQPKKPATEVKTKNKNTNTKKHATGEASKTKKTKRTSKQKKNEAIEEAKPVSIEQKRKNYIDSFPAGKERQACGSSLMHKSKLTGKTNAQIIESRVKDGSFKYYINNKGEYKSVNMKDKSEATVSSYIYGYYKMLGGEDYVADTVEKVDNNQETDTQEKILETINNNIEKTKEQIKQVKQANQAEKTAKETAQQESQQKTQPVKTEESNMVVENNDSNKENNNGNNNTEEKQTAKETSVDKLKQEIDNQNKETKKIDDVIYELEDKNNYYRQKRANLDAHSQGEMRENVIKQLIDFYKEDNAEGINIKESIIEELIRTLKEGAVLSKNKKNTFLKTLTVDENGNESVEKTKLSAEEAKFVEWFKTNIDSILQKTHAIDKKANRENKLKESQQALKNKQTGAKLNIVLDKFQKLLTKCKINISLKEIKENLSAIDYANNKLVIEILNKAKKDGWVVKNVEEESNALGGTSSDAEGGFWLYNPRLYTSNAKSDFQKLDKEDRRKSKKKEDSILSQPEARRLTKVQYLYWRALNKSEGETTVDILKQAEDEFKFSGNAKGLEAHLKAVEEMKKSEQTLENEKAKEVKDEYITTIPPLEKSAEEYKANLKKPEIEFIDNLLKKDRTLMRISSGENKGKVMVLGEKRNYFLDNKDKEGYYFARLKEKRITEIGKDKTDAQAKPDEASNKQEDTKTKKSTGISNEKKKILQLAAKSNLPIKYSDKFGLYYIPASKTNKAIAFDNKEEKEYYEKLLKSNAPKNGKTLTKEEIMRRIKERAEKQKEKNAKPEEKAEEGALTGDEGWAENNLKEKSDYEYDNGNDEYNYYGNDLRGDYNEEEETPEDESYKGYGRGYSSENEKYSIVNNTIHAIAKKLGVIVQPKTRKQWLDLIKKSFPEMPMELKGDTVIVKLPNGITAKIKLGQEIKFTAEDRLRAEQELGRPLKEGETPVGSYTTSADLEGIITLTDLATEKTLNHEAFHMARIFALDGKMNKMLDTFFKGNEEKMADAYAQYRADMSHFKSKILNKAFQRIMNFARRITNAFGLGEAYINKDVRTTFESLADGSAWAKGLTDVTVNNEGDVVSWGENIKPNFGDVRFSIAPRIVSMLKDYMQSTAEDNARKYAKQNNIDVKIIERERKGYGISALSRLGIRSPKHEIKNVNNKIAWLLKSFIQQGQKAHDEQEGLRARWGKLAKKAFESIEKEDMKNLSDLLFLGDLQEREYSKEDITNMGYSENVAKAYKRIRNLMEEIYKNVNDVYQRVQHKTERVSVAEIEEMKKNKFINIMRTTDITNPNDVDYGTGKVIVDYEKRPSFRKRKLMGEDELNLAKASPDMQILSISNQRKDGRYLVEFDQSASALYKITGYMPHFFKAYLIKAKDTDGKQVVVGSGNTFKEAIEVAKAIQEDGSYSDFIIIPKGMAIENNEDIKRYATGIGDKDFVQNIENQENYNTITLAEAEDLLENNVAEKTAHRRLDNLEFRSGAKGYIQDARWSVAHYINVTSRYVALEKIKPRLISAYERFFGPYNGSSPKPLSEAGYMKRYIETLNGNPSGAEKFINSIINNSKYADAIKQICGIESWGDRPAIGLSNNISSFVAITRLGGLNISTAVVNLTQLTNALGYIDIKHLSKGILKALSSMKKGALTKSEIEILIKAGTIYNLDISDSNAYSSTSQRNTNKFLNKVASLGEKSLFFFKKAETFNRIVATLGGYYQAKADGKSEEKAIEFARRVNDNVNFDYSTVDQPAIFSMLRGSVIGDAMLMFKKYPIKEMETIIDVMTSKETPTSRKIRFIGAMMLMGGLFGGIPASNMIFSLLNYFTGLSDQDAKTMIINSLDNKNLSDILLYGLASQIGVDISHRAGMGDVLDPLEGDVISFVGGAPLSTAKQIGKGIISLKDGEFIPFAKAMLPEVGNLLEAAKGYTVNKNGKINFFYRDDEAILKALGFNPVRKASGFDYRVATNSKIQEEKENGTYKKIRTHRAKQEEPTTATALLEKYYDEDSKKVRGIPQSELKKYKIKKAFITSFLQRKRGEI